jgi:hypothetical protein
LAVVKQTTVDRHSEWASGEISVENPTPEMPKSRELKKDEKV